MFVMLIVSLVLMLFVDRKILSSTAEDTVVSFVWENADKIVNNGNRLDLSGVDTQSKGAYLSVYNEKNKLLKGSLPEDFDNDEVPFHGGVLSSTRQGGEDYYVYDLQWNLTSKPLMLRGVIPASINHYKLITLAITAILWSAVIIFIGVFGADYIAKRTYMPIEALTEKAAQISGGDKLSERILLENSSEEMKKLEQTFNGMFERLETSFDAEKQFVSDASHELRTPTTVILAECARAKKKAVTKEDYEFSLGIIEEQGKKMAHMISQLLSITRLEQGTEQVKMKVADYSAFVTACCEEFIPADRRGISFSTLIEPNIKISFDPGLMSRVIQNLLENAYKYGRENGKILVALKKHGDKAMLYVIDDGIGIAEEDQQHIFKRFWQVDPSRGEDYGAGLGLSMVKQICEFHGGDISVISAPGDGSSFIVSLPAQ